MTDQANSPVAKTSVKIDSADTGLTRTEESSEEGYYTFPNLPLGRYTVTFQKDGFETLRNHGHCT